MKAMGSITGFGKVLMGILFVLLSSTSCNEDEFLKEAPLDFFSPDNSFVTFQQYESALLQLYTTYRNEIWAHDNGGDGVIASQMLGTDLILNNRQITRVVVDFASLWHPTAARVATLWNNCYRIIFDANAIIGRVVEGNELTPDQQNQVSAEAKLFRGLCYKMLANTYGGVPLVLEEITSAKRDFVRAARTSVYEQAAADLEAAAAGLNDISSVEDHRVSKEVANHFLSEVYLSLERWNDAIAAATATINNPATELMTSRFGARVNDPDFGGDVYWDLFRQSNQNRGSGNSEALWVLSFKSLTPGGFNPDRGRTYAFERFFSPRTWRADIQDTDGQTRNLVAGGPNSFVTGRSSGFMRGTAFFYGELWTRSGPGDIRNSEHNIIRDFRVLNPDSPSNGLFADANGLIKKESYLDTAISFFPAWGKCTTPGKHPPELFAADQTIPGSLTSQAGTLWRDHYAARLAETYLFRAEAHLGAGNASAAADDLNVVRSRSNAEPVMAGQVDIDYILDERLRELHLEVFRAMTLRRLGRIDRARIYNPIFGASIKEHHNLWPIPFSEIELNTESPLEQNPGY